MHIGGPAFRLSAAKKMRIYAAANSAILLAVARF
jgi:hypothetical protein